MKRLPSDARLARRAAAGHERAFAAIYERYHQALYRFCLSILSRPEDAEDALQNTMVKALRALPGEERQIELKPWLYRIARNESIEVLRKRREGVELDAERTLAAAAASEPTEAAAQRERLRHLLADLEQLPERQRASLVMRELGGLGFEQIGSAFETSAAVARQTIYEARLSLGQLEAGREMGCDEVTRQLSDADGRVLRRRDIQAHLRSCADCRGFREAISARRHDLAALAPLPAAAAGSILHGLLGVGAGAGSGAAGSAVGVGAGKAVATSTAVKAVATIAVVATVGVTAADRGGLIDAGLPGGGTSSLRSSGSSADDGTLAAPAHAAVPSAATAERAGGSDGAAAGLAASRRARRLDQASGRALAAPAGNGSHSGPGPSTNTAAGGPSTSLPLASEHGQQTAAAHKASPKSPAAKGKSHSAGHGNGGNRGHSKQGNDSESPPAKVHEPPGRTKHNGKSGPKSQSTKGEAPPAHENKSAQPQEKASTTDGTEPSATEKGDETEASP